jgi:aspartate aminotransferase
LRAAGVDVVDLGAGEPDFPTPDNVKQAAIRALDGNFTKYTAAAGALELRNAVCERHAEEFGTDYRPEECIITSGGKHAIFAFTQALLEPGDHVVIPTPCWMTFRDASQYAGAECVFVDTTREQGFELTAARIQEALDDRVRMVIVNSPSNPTGATVDRGEFEKIVRLTAERGIYLLTDECYANLVYSGDLFSASSVSGAKNNVLVAGTLSKTYAMTGWRVGFGLAPAPVIAAMVKLQSHSISNVTSIAQKAAVEALQGSRAPTQAMLEEYRRRRDFVIPRLRCIPGVTCSQPAGAFYAYPNVSVALRRGALADTTEFAAKLLEERRVAIVPGEAFGSTDYVRISFAASLQNLERGLDRIHEFVVQHS